ncbi:MAG: DUF368 domain-containing protein [Desulfobulbaceae bacterium]|nr:MAG: DUF368 domain-containing protein [Desulfobulbaceae bacterium]
MRRYAVSVGKVSQLSEKTYIFSKETPVKQLKQFLILLLKGTGMGAANVIPGVSGGTVALITGIFEELIDSIKAFNVTALLLLLKGRFGEFARHVNLSFLFAVFLGVGISILSLARLLEFLFLYYPVFIWAYFFGLILASVYFVGKTISAWDGSVILMFIIGTAIALSISFISPARENDSFIYLVLCGVVAICSMILPGLSGSFVLILMGNYQLIVISAVNDLNIQILIPVMIGAGAGLVAFSHLLSWIFKKFRNQTLSLLTGFILGSLIILWPWKRSFDQAGDLILTNRFGAFVDQSGTMLGEVKVYQFSQVLPERFDSVALYALLLVIVGVVSIILMEYASARKEQL